MIGSPELIVILIVVLLLFGPQKLPELAKALGRATGEYHKATREFEREAMELKKISKEALSNEGVDIRKIAESLDISVKDKNDADLLKEVGTKVKQSK